MTNPSTAHRPEAQVALADAASHLQRATSAIRAAASLDPGTAQNLAVVHAVLADQLDAITALRADAAH